MDSASNREQKSWWAPFANPEEMLNQWKKLLAEPFPGFPSADKGFDGFFELSKSWQENWVNLQKSWIAGIDKALPVYAPQKEKGAETEDTLNAWMKAWGEMASTWLLFIDEQTKAFYRLWKAEGAEPQETQETQRNDARTRTRARK